MRIFKRKNKSRKYYQRQLKKLIKILSKHPDPIIRKSVEEYKKEHFIK